MDASLKAGMLSVYNLSLSGEWGFYIKLREVMDVNGPKRVVMAGGEILERYRMKRGAFDANQYEGLKTDHLGNFVADK